VKAQTSGRWNLRFGSILDATPPHCCDERHTIAPVRVSDSRTSIARTALDYHLHFHRSAQRFERDTYHGDALPTELRGHNHRISCPARCGRHWHDRVGEHPRPEIIALTRPAQRPTYAAPEPGRPAEPS